jgi:DNA-directed RNA polymerase subunit omega
MAQRGFDDLMKLTDSRYRLSMIVARRAAQLKGGIPTLLEVDERPRSTNAVTVAMEELRLNKPVRWGEDIPTTDELKRVVERSKRLEENPYEDEG